MRAEIISVGTELLMGNIVNTNAAFLSQKLAELGISCFYQSTVGDNKERLFDAIKTAIDRADLVILSGGLGPTEDDLTKETAAEACGKTLYMDEHSKKRIEEYFKNKGKKPTDNNWKQAMMPEGAVVIDNKNGTAPGVILETEKNTVVLLPGPPMELVPMFENQIVPYLSKKSGQVFISRMIKIFGMGESAVETKLLPLIDAQTNPTIATYAKEGEVHVRVTASAADEKEAKRLLKPVVRKIKSLLGDVIYTTKESETLESTVVRLLKKKKWKIATAESCTGGLAAGRLINVAGVSECMEKGFVTYSNEAKHELLGVKKKTIRKYGVVSGEVAKEMAERTREVTGAEVALSVTGVAGPDGGTKETPVGTCFIACSTPEKTEVRECHFYGTREKVRTNAVTAMMGLCVSCLKK